MSTKSSKKSSGGSGKQFSIDQEVPQYPIDMSKQQKNDDSAVSPSEQQQRSKALDINLYDLQRLYADMSGMSSLELSEINEIRDKAKHIYPDVKEYYYYSREESINQYYKRFAKWYKLRKELGIHLESPTSPKNRALELTQFQLDSGPLTLHYMAFLPALELLASPEQAKEFVPKVHNLEITGAYVQTELGHGSDVMSLQTTATYDEKTKEIVINTPTREATKFWPGGLGKTANYILLYARLISLGKDHGINVFLIPIRSLEDHKPLPGIQVGDIGQKLGFRNSDQGFLSFDNVRYPKSCLLDRFVKLADDGTFTASTSAAKKLSYGGMLNLRSLMIFGSHQYMAYMAIIAARYSFKRRQFVGRDGPKYPETMVIQYQMQQYKVVPAFSYSWMMLLVANQMFQMYRDYNEKLEAMDRGDKNAKPFEVLKDLHGIVSGFKALTTWDGEKYSEILKQACGGHGYMQLSGLHKIHTDFGFGWQMTEGDNTVMSQQTARYLLQQVQSGDLVLDQFEFDINKNLSLDEELLLLYEMRFKNEVMRAGLILQDGDGNFMDKWNEKALIHLVQSNVYFTEYWALKNFYDLLKGKKSLFSYDKPLGKLTDRPEPVQKMLHLMFRNNACFNIFENSVSFFKNIQNEEIRNYFSAAKIDSIKVNFKKELEILAMSLPTICDGFMYRDEQLLSVLGKGSHKNDSELYDEMLEVVRNNPINKRTVAKGVKRYITPILNGKL